MIKIHKISKLEELSKGIDNKEITKALEVLSVKYESVGVIIDNYLYGDMVKPNTLEKAINKYNTNYNEVEDKIIKAKKYEVGKITTRSDGQKYKKVSDTGNTKNDWKLVTNDKSPKKEGKNQENPTKDAKKQEYTDKELTAFAKDAKTEDLKTVSNGKDERLKTFADKELESRGELENKKEKVEKK